MSDIYLGGGETLAPSPGDARGAGSVSGAGGVGGAGAWRAVGAGGSAGAGAGGPGASGSGLDAADAGANALGGGSASLVASFGRELYRSFQVGASDSHKRCFSSYNVTTSHSRATLVSAYTDSPITVSSEVFDIASNAARPEV